MVKKAELLRHICHNFILVLFDYNITRVLMIIYLQVLFSKDGNYLYTGGRKVN